MREMFKMGKWCKIIGTPAAPGLRFGQFLKCVWYLSQTRFAKPFCEHAARADCLGIADDNQPRKRTQTQVYVVLRDGRNDTAIQRQAAEQAQDGRPRAVQVAAAVVSGGRRLSRNVMALASRGKGLASATPTCPPRMRSDHCGEVHWTALSSSDVEFGCGALMSCELPRDFAIGDTANSHGGSGCT